jgi:hypothetical protein
LQQLPQQTPCGHSPSAAAAVLRSRQLPALLPALLLPLVPPLLMMMGWGRTLTTAVLCVCRCQRSSCLAVPQVWVQLCVCVCVRNIVCVEGWLGGRGELLCGTYVQQRGGVERVGRCGWCMSVWVCVNTKHMSSTC